MDERIRFEEKVFLQNNECLNYQPMSPESLRNLIKLNSSIVYYENGLSLDKRIRAFENYSSKSVYSRLLLAGLYAQNKSPEKVKEVLKDLNSEDFLQKGTKDFDMVVSRTLYPYCLKMNLNYCLKVTENLKDKVLRPWP